MRQLTWSEKSSSDLDAIYAYIAADSPFYASLQIERLISSAERLKEFPDSGRKLPEFPDLPYREIICGAYRVIYRHELENDLVLVVTVAHSAQLISRLIDS